MKLHYVFCYYEFMFDAGALVHASYVPGHLHHADPQSVGEYHHSNQSAQGHNSDCLAPLCRYMSVQLCPGGPS